MTTIYIYEDREKTKELMRFTHEPPAPGDRRHDFYRQDKNGRVHNMTAWSMDEANERIGHLSVYAKIMGFTVYIDWQEPFVSWKDANRPSQNVR